MSVTCQPREARRSETAAPATPAPMTIACFVFVFLRFFVLRIKRPASISLFVPNPWRFSTANPAPSSASRTEAATLQVASVAPGAASRPEVAQQPRLPHLRVLRRREAVEVERVRRQLQLRQPLGDVAEKEGQDDIAALELQAVHAGHEHRPACEQLPGFAFQFWDIFSNKTARSAAAKGCFSTETKCSRSQRCGIVAPGLPGREERQPEAEAGFEDREGAAALPAPGQAVAVAGTRGAPARARLRRCDRRRRRPPNTACRPRRTRGRREPAGRAPRRSGARREHPHFALRHRRRNAGAAERFQDRLVDFAGRRGRSPAPSPRGRRRSSPRNRRPC